MKMSKKLANILLAVFLILTGLAAFGITFPLMQGIIGICATMAGVLFLIGR